VVAAIEPTVRKAEIERARIKHPENMDAYDLLLQALPYIYQVHPESNLKALDFLMQAIDLDSEYAPALAHASWGLVQRITRPWAPFREDDRGLSVSLAHRALAVGSDDAQAVVLGGFVLTMLREDYLTGLDAVRRAVNLNPGSGFVNAMAGCALIFGDDPIAGLKLLDKAMLLGPKDPSFFSHLTVAAFGHLACERPEQGFEFALRSIALNSKWDSTYVALIAACTLLDRHNDAKNAAEKLLAMHPEASASRYDRVLPVRNESFRKMIIKCLKQAGVPD
jgi:tetratricopeptide (TPR) repeat protein